MAHPVTNGSGRRALLPYEHHSFLGLFCLFRLIHADPPALDNPQPLLDAFLVQTPDQRSQGVGRIPRSRPGRQPEHGNTVIV